MQGEEMDPEQVYEVWLGEEARVASFHPVAGYRKESFSCHAFFLKYLHGLQSEGWRFQ